MDAPAWTASAEVDQLRAETARSSAPGIAIAKGLAFIEHADALTIDPRPRQPWTCVTRSLDTRESGLVPNSSRSGYSLK
jgi:hypothetical protein